jgi:hypothetical protein
MAAATRTRRLTIGCSGCGALHAFGRDESLARRPRTTDPCVVRPLGKHRGSRRGYSSSAAVYFIPSQTQAGEPPHYHEADQLSWTSFNSDHTHGAPRLALSRGA